MQATSKQNTDYLPFQREYLNEVFLSLAEKSRDVFWVRSADYKEQLYISPMFEKIWGRKISELYYYPERWDEWIYPEDKRALDESISKRNPNTHPDDVFFENYRIIRPNGEIRWIKDCSFPIFNNKNILICFAGIAQDTTEERLHKEELNEQKNKAETANRVKTQLIRNLSHDIRTPLGGIAGMTDLIMSKVKEEELHQDLQQIHTAAKSLLNLLNDIMVVAQAELGEIPDRQRKFSLNGLIQDVVDLFTPATIDKNLHLQINYDQQLPITMIGNDLILHQVIMNLVGNAVKFTDKGSIQINSRLINKSEKQLLIEITVKDTGVGIPEDKHEFIFAPFNRLTPSFENKYKGSGLGLYMVAEFIRHLGGEIHVESTVGKGSAFKCILPFTRTLTENFEEPLEAIHYARPELMLNPVIKMEEKLLTSTPVNATTSATPEKTLSILLLEDDLLAQKMGQGFFNQLRQTVTVTQTGMAALQVSQQQKFDLLVFDLGLPDIGGCEVAKRVRQDNNNPNQNTFIIALTAHADDQIREECNAAGIAMVYDKPLTLDTAKTIIAITESKTVIPILDTNVALQMFQNNEQMMHEILQTLIADLPARKHAITQAYAEKNLVDLQYHVHKLHGAVSYCGALRLKAAAKSLEDILRADKQEEIDKHYHQLLQEIENLIQTYHVTYQ